MSAKTVKIRVRLLITHEGKWAAYGYTEDDGRDEYNVCGDVLSGEDCDWAKRYLLEAEVPVPEQGVVAGVLVAQVSEDEQ